jgi:hypothetical protein
MVRETVEPKLKTLQRALSLALTLLLTFGVALCAPFSVTVNAASTPTTVTLSNTNLILKEFETESLSAVVSPSDADQAITWAGEASTIATVSQSGLVTATGQGHTTIAAKASNGVSASCKVSVYTPYRNLVATTVQATPLYTIADTDSAYLHTASPVASGTYTPVPGNLIYYNWDKEIDGIFAHVGIVIGVNGSNIYTIEGNTMGSNDDGYGITGQVYRKVRDKNYSCIKGYSSVNFKEGT